MSFSVETERLLLRDYEERDWQPIVESFQDPLVQDYILAFQSKEPFIRQMFESGLSLAGQELRFGYQLAITLKEQDQFIGTCSIRRTVAGATLCQIGWHIASPHKGRGYATEAARQLLRIGFQTHAVERIFAECFAHNLDSLRVMEKLGMKPHRSGLLARWFRGVHYGEKRAIVRRHILKSQWQAQPP